MAAKGVLGIQELSDQIVDHLVADHIARGDSSKAMYAAHFVYYPPHLSLLQVYNGVIEEIARHASSRYLHSVALISPQLCASAQSHIFRDIILAPEELEHHCGRDPVTFMDRHYDVRAACLRLCTILHESPHLVKYVRRLSAEVNSYTMSDTMTPLAEIAFPNLREICFYEIDTSGGENDPVHKLAKKKIALPSARAITLEQCRPSFDLLTTLFETSSHLIELNFDGVYVPGAFIPANVTPRSQRATIEKLRLRGPSPAFVDWLLAPSSPFDFSQLVDFDFSNCKRPGSNILQLVTGARNTIVRLSVTSELAALIDFSTYTAITSLEITFFDLEDPSLLSDLRKAMSRFTHTSRIETIVFSGISDDDYLDRDFMTALDTLVASHLVPSIHRVEMRITGPIEGKSIELSALPAYFPQLDSKGLLVVTDHKTIDFNVLYLR
ncbi:hypothetical protein C8J57DRAFT_314986 [Mycena rebaudengoi]|nr:hypothetical protein C8J57DRAFT_1358770 [Mycena rebaudengoi]KAJ7269459.1 hypothetical protein C8J57DRAFT_314986 [Mycena rebaudengoi]